MLARKYFLWNCSRKMGEVSPRALTACQNLEKFLIHNLRFDFNISNWKIFNFKFLKDFRFKEPRPAGTDTREQCADSESKRKVSGVLYIGNVQRKIWHRKGKAFEWRTRCSENVIRNEKRMTLWFGNKRNSDVCQCEALCDLLACQTSPRLSFAFVRPLLLPLPS